MSSTSQEVSELFNGEGVMGVLGKPSIIETYNREKQCYQDQGKTYFDFPSKQYVLHDLQSAKENRAIMTQDNYRRRSYYILSNTPPLQQNPPNLMLNEASF